MANIPMKTLRLHGLDDTYTIPTAPEHIGAAPAGLMDGTIWPQSYDHLETLIADIYTQVPTSATRHFVVNDQIGLPYLGGGIWFAELSKMVEGFCTLKMRSYLSNSIRELSRSMCNGVWGDWKSVGPSAFAPAGYGLGEKVGRYCADCYSGTQLGLYYIDGNTANLPNGVTSGVLLVEGRASPYGHGVDFYLTIRCETQIWHCYYSSWAGQWQPWECENPPMVLGVEYRTTERCNDRAVYAKRVQYTMTSAIAADNGVVDTVIPHGISNFSELVRCDCWKQGYVLPYLKDNGGFTAIVEVLDTGIKMRVCKASWSPSVWNIDLYYVKS